MLYVLEPEVAGGFGEHTKILEHGDEVLQAKHILHLHYEFEGWLGDELLTTHPCYLVTERVADFIQSSGCTGVEFGKVQISMSETFLELKPGVTLPSFKRLLPLGSVVLDGDRYTNWSGHDVSSNEKSELVVTDKVLKVLQPYISNDCIVTALQPMDNRQGLKR
ncbi:hypothetical protein [Tumebacillus flagellatus]|uniref:Uncharacterized protein n=1 Tax=Tumebacillus flagellatus TaxID=1157490 RepID=A0A074MA00_9BACL|nr:hypothetical protein [Tumebacillus flagellatus]KEO82792.1 hypothetical protein EL26_13670 [Tumebacillus flagellatus]